MTSTTSDAGQRKLRQSFTPPASQTVDVSPSDEVVLSASGESRHAAIWISDDETDTEDEGDDEGQNFDNSQSCTTPTTSIADHLDSTGNKHSPTESKAAISTDTTPAGSPARVEDDPTWTHDSNTGPLVDPEPNQQSPCQTICTSAGDTMACTDTSFDVSPTNPESQPCFGVSDEQQLATGATRATGKPGIMMMIDPLSDEGSCHRAQSTPASPSMHTYSPIAASPEEIAQTQLHGREVCASTRNDAIPGASTSSPAVRLSAESQEEQDFDHTICESSDAESGSSEAESGSPFEARLSPPSQELTSRRRSPRRSSHAHETVQARDSDVYTEGSSSEDGLDVPECVRDEDYCPSPPKVQGHGSGDDSDDEEQHGRKRRRVYRSPQTLVRSTPASARSSRQRRSTRRTAQLPRARPTSVCGIESPTPSQARPVLSEASTFLARFEEWPLRDVILKRITEGDKTTFQLQFEWTPDSSQPLADRSVSHPKKGRRPPKASLSATRSSGDKWTSEEEDTVRRMRQDGYSWAEIQRALPHRSQGTIQVRYSTKLNKKVDEVGH
ncbi:hypothetical protein IWW34DRAFT_787330 [Fusarium oxysporum f. sp. albedinis]|nr:hypothetical protein IWW34DRAFT_787330 [Fusarium oxysporum f. sp. albedinis]KAK2477145.1 hypothetical protein H9L39_12369 [Fusarium oxysporum f. sp. albedinis]